MYKTPIAAGKIFVGNVNQNGEANTRHGPRNCPVYVTFELRQTNKGPEFSAQAEAWKPRRDDIFMGGQCLESFAHMMHGDAKRILEIWREWHLNGMNAGTPEQEAALEAEKKIAVEKALATDNPGRWFWNLERRELNPHTLDALYGLGSRLSYYDWACHILKERGLYEVPHPVTGKPYRYGHEWLYRALPVAVVEEVKAIAIRHGKPAR